MDCQKLTSMSLPASQARLSYQAQDCAMTLRQGLAEYYGANSGLFDTSQASSDKLGAYLRNHDVTHVVFGTTTVMADEMLQDMWTFLAVDVGNSVRRNAWQSASEYKRRLKPEQK
jgi:hypothetical protein